MKLFTSSWRLGATSFVLPAEIADNVRFLAGKVDDVQLLFFESLSRSRLPHHLDVDLLKSLAGEHDLSYTVHLPLDLKLTSTSAAERNESVGEISRIVDEVAELSPHCFDLHLDYYQQADRMAWLAAIDHSLHLLSRKLGDLAPKIAVENIDYPFREVRSLVLGHGMSFCLDFGHALYYGDDVGGLLADIPRAAHIHYHGVADRDHRPLTSRQRDLTVRIGEGMRDCDYRGIFTLEVYNAEALEQSLLELSEAWGEKW